MDKKNSQVDAFEEPRQNSASFGSGDPDDFARSSCPYLAALQAAGQIDDVNKQLCACCCKPLRQRSSVTQFMDAGDGLPCQINTLGLHST